MRNMRIAGRLILIPAALLILMIGVGIGGFIGMSRMQQAMSGIYNDRVVPLRDLKQVSDAYAVNIVDTTHKARSGALDRDRALRNVAQANETIAQRWKAYTATELTPEERRLIEETRPLMRAADAGAEDLAALLRAGDAGGIESFAATRLYPLIDPVTAQIDKLIALQLTTAKADADAAGALFETLTWLGAALMAAGVMLGVGIALWIGSGITGPLRSLTAAMRGLADGDLGVAIPAVRFHDEVEEMGQALTVFKQNAARQRQLEAEEKAAIAEREARQRRIEALTSGFDAVVHALIAKVRTLVEHLHHASEALSRNAEQAQHQSATVSAATEEATANVETVSAASAELNASIAEISRQVQHSATIARDATREAGATNDRMGDLVAAADAVGEIVGLISDIANETNLLALNATIESARAGETGKGFAVVANEVKTLAGQTARATGEITRQISAIQSETQSAVAAIQGVANTVGRIDELFSAIAGAVEEQGAATAEISRNVEQASQGTRQVADTIAGIATAARETGEMAQDVFSVADDLLRESQELEREVQSFLRQVRHA